MVHRMNFTSDQQKVIEHLEQIEEIGELILAKQEQCVSCDRSRQKTREAIQALRNPESGEKQWACLAGQFFRLPRDSLRKALQDDMKVYDSEIEKTRKDLKDDINHLHELEDKRKLQGFDLIALSKEDVVSMDR
ncbi:unnamed protein product [Calicophoron daubneyi]|uniref:P53 and DNA damage-regulated protein 1 n=1 Tax=Calicophoron daubneyi TaxID=300641 RepID=A0AAV2TIP2_CALDB